MDISSSSSTTQPRQKRVLPSRSRRAGPGAGVGNCDADQMILDTHRRKLEDVPLIPENTRFFLTTNPALAPPEASSSRVAINARSDDRYFDRPEVIKAFRQQTNIETPEFVNINETQEVLSRFRARDDDATMDTSDAAYERRHRKYETMEKRQRLRELEKLKHEQYKLKERMEQLRSMDPNAFLALPASCFTPIPGHVPVGVDDTTGGHVNGAAAIQEGERRRKEMLEVAQMLENRYRVLLPPERHARKVPGGSNTPAQHIAQLPAPSESEFPASRTIPARLPKRFNIEVDNGESEVDEENQIVEHAQPEAAKLTLKIRVPQKKTPDANKPSRATNQKKAPPAHSPPPVTPMEEPPPFPPSIPQSAATATSDRADSELAPILVPIEMETHNSSLTATPLMSSPAIAVLEQPTTDDPDMSGQQHARTDVSSKATGKARVRDKAKGSEPGQPPKKRTKLSQVPSHSEMPTETISAAITREQSIPPIETISESVSAPPGQSRAAVSKPPRLSKKPQQECQLLAAARRNVGSSRQARHNTAFGVKCPAELEMELTYELPLWLLMDDEFQKRAAKYHPHTGVLDPDFHLDPQFIEDVRRASTEPVLEMKNVLNQDLKLEEYSKLKNSQVDSISDILNGRNDEKVPDDIDIESEDEVVDSRDGQ